MKKVICLLISGILLISALCSFSACGKKGEDANTISYFLYQGNEKYDVSYKMNPQIEWWEAQEWQGAKIDLEIMIPSRSLSPSEAMRTMIASGDYPDIIDFAAFEGYTFPELYHEEIIMDITPYVEQYMPNYTNYIKENPDIALVTTQNVDGEKKYLALYNLNDQAMLNSWSLSYRRDWILKYGKNPLTGVSFTGGYDESGEWSDDIIFPNGENVPIYLSDWEWMFEIFEIAIKDLGLENDANSYCISVPYSGSDQLSGLTGAFNVNACFYLDNEGYARFGMTEDNYKVYFEAMRTWYKNEWIDKTFYERSTDQPFQINMSAVASGKVGSWYGQLAFLGPQIKDASTPYLENAYVSAARPPLNDIYGKGTGAYWDAETNNFYNGNLYCYSKIGSSYVVSTNAAEKNLPALFTMFDAAYSLEGCMVHNYGFTEEQQAIYQNQLMRDNNLTASYEYAYYDDGTPVLNSKGEHMVSYVESLILNEDLSHACHGSRVFGRHKSSLKYIPRAKYLQLSYDEMMNFVDGPYIRADITGLFAPDITACYNDSASYSRNQAETVLYKFITGELDIKSAADWKSWTDLFDRDYKNGMTYNDAIKKSIDAINEITGHN